MPNMTVGAAIAHCRKEKGWSLQALGNKFSPPKSAPEISRWERSRVKPSAKHMLELFGIFGSKFTKLISVDRQTSQANFGEEGRQ